MTSHLHTLALLAAHYRGERHDSTKTLKRAGQSSALDLRRVPLKNSESPRPCSEVVGVVEHMAKVLTLRADSLVVSQVLMFDKRETTCNVKFK